MRGARERLPAFGARTFPTVITGSRLNEKNRWSRFYDALIIYCIARIVAEPYPRFRSFAI
jgi:hypothetical protein